MRSRVVARSPALRAACCATWVPQHVPRLLEQGGARDGELDAARDAVEELDPELLLESAHLLAYCRLRDVKALRSLLTALRNLDAVFDAYRMTPGG